MSSNEKSRLRDVLIAVSKICGVVFLCTLFGFMAAKFDHESAAMIYFVGIIYIATTGAFWKSMLASILSVLAFDFFVTPPIFSFNPESPHYLITFAIMFVLSVFTSRMVKRYSHAMDTLVHQSEIIDLTSDAIIEWNAASQEVIFWNKGAEKMFAISSDDACGRKLHDVLNLPSNFNDDVMANVQRFGFYNCDRTYTRAEHAPVSVSSRWAFKAGKSLTESSIIEFCTDISQKKMAETRVKEFYSTVSHELRTPLTSIKAALTLLENHVVMPASENGGKLIVLARNQSDHLHNLINDILDLQKIESGSFKLNKVVLELSSIISSVINELSINAESAQVSIVHDGEIDYMVEADKIKIKQVLTNLVGNAIKFSRPQSEIRISTRKEGIRVRVSIADSGIGIPEDQIHKLFGKFQQVDQTDTRSHGGTGLGLAISKAIIEQHKGAIGVDTKYGAGSTFWFELDPYEKR